MLNYSLTWNGPKKSYTSPLDFTCCGQLWIKWKQMWCSQCYRQIILGLGFKMSPGWGHVQTYSDVKTGPAARHPHFQRDGYWQSEGTVSDGASSISCSQQIKTKCLPGSHALAKHVSLSSVRGQLWNIKTLDKARTDEMMWSLPPAMNYELRKHKLSIGYPRYLNGHLRPHVP